MTEETRRKLECLKNYDGRLLRLMEICGSHTAQISKTGLRSLISKKIELISGPGCPVCVTPSSYIDRLAELALSGTTVCAFGDMLRVPGRNMSLSEAKGNGADVRMLYSPLDIIRHAKEEPEHDFVFAAVGFETTTPAYALLLSELVEQDIKNVKLLTSLKTMPEAVARLCETERCPDGFLAPGHVCAISGYKAYEELAEKYGTCFAVAGFEAEELIDALFGLAEQVGAFKTGKEKSGNVKNYYEKAVSREGNERAKAFVDRFFVPADANWRGLGVIEGSGLILREEYKKFDAGSTELAYDNPEKTGCRCGDVLSGRLRPDECPLFKKACTPLSPKGACMVSEEGACGAYLL